MVKRTRDELEKEEDSIPFNGQLLQLSSGMSVIQLRPNLRKVVAHLSEATKHHRQPPTPIQEGKLPLDLLFRKTWVAKTWNPKYEGLVHNLHAKFCELRIVFMFSIRRHHTNKNTFID